MSGGYGRRDFLANVGALIVGSSSVILNGRLGNAAGFLTDEEARNVLQDSKDSLIALNDAVSMGEYEALRIELRRGALGQLRAAGNVLSLSEEDKKSYRKLISSVEQLDSHALRAERGGNGDVVPGDIARAVEALEVFLNK